MLFKQSLIAVEKTKNVLLVGRGYGHVQGWNYRLIIDGVILYFSFIVDSSLLFNYRFPTLVMFMN